MSECKKRRRRTPANMPDAITVPAGAKMGSAPAAKAPTRPNQPAHLTPPPRGGLRGPQTLTKAAEAMKMTPRKLMGLVAQGKFPAPDLRIGPNKIGAWSPSLINDHMRHKKAEILGHA